MSRKKAGFYGMEEDDSDGVEDVLFDLFCCDRKRGIVDIDYFLEVSLTLNHLPLHMKPPFDRNLSLG